MPKTSAHSTRLRLDKLLVERGLVPSREAAREAIEQGIVRVAGFVQSKPASMVPVEASVSLVCSSMNADDAWVSRGAHKLLKGLDHWNIDPTGWSCIDIGASTGGFTQVLLRRGAARVAAVDVGYGQLAWILRNDPRVQVRERTNARYLSPEDIGWQADLITADASFISLRLLLPVFENLLKDEGLAIALVKPQFEVGRTKIGKGVVRDPVLHVEVLQGLCAFLNEKTRLRLRAATFSPIRGPEGNIEFIFLMDFLRNARDDANVLQERPDFDKLVLEAHETFRAESMG